MKTPEETKSVSMWCGRPVTELSREELLEVVEYLGREICHLRSLPVDWRAHARERLGLSPHPA